MPETTWGRRETVIWPPHKPIYTLGALFLALIATGFFVYIHFAFALTPLERFYLPTYIKTAIAPSLRSSGKYQMLLIADGGRHAWYAREEDVQAGSTQQVNAKPIQLALSEAARQRGVKFLYRSVPLVFQNTALNTYFKQQIYDGQNLTEIFWWPLILGVLFLLGQLPFSIPKDIRRRKEMKYGRRLNGPILVTPKQFNRAIQGTGIGLKVDQCRELLRVPLSAEDQHFEIIGDTGSGKTTIIVQMLRQIQTRGHSAILYDPACEFIERFYDSARGDIVLNPLDRRCPYWGPSEELVRRAEARTIAASLFQPTSDKKGEFFIESPQKIFAHLLLDLPSPQQLVQWMSHPEEIDRRVRNTELASIIDPSAPQQRSGVLGSLSLIADSFRLLPKKEDAKTEWTAREWSKDRKGWIFITSQPAEREALRPLHSLWIDMLVLRLLSVPKPEQHPVWFVLDELASLQKLPQLHTAITENRKSRNPIVLGFQGKAQLEVIYGHLAEVMLSQPATKIFLKTTEPNAAEWVSRAVGKVEIERIKETHFDGSRTGKNFALDRQTEPLVLDSEISGLENLHAYLKHGNYVARFSFSVLDVPATKPKFIERLEDDYIVREPAQKQQEEPRIPAPVSTDLTPPRATRQLGDAGVEAGTLQGFLARSAVATPPEQKHFYFVDESSLASTNQMREFLSRIALQDRVLLIGDTRQHQGVETRGPFEQLQEAGMRTAKLDEIVRQKDPALKSAVEMLATGQVSDALDALQRQGRVREIPNAEERIRAIARSYVESPERTLIVSPDNASRRELNAAVRLELKANGTIAPEDHSFRILVQRQDMTGAERSRTSRYEINDVVRYARGSKGAGIEAGEYGTVVGINSAANLLTVERSSGKLANYDPRRLTGVSVYREVAHEFSVGDCIQFTAPDKTLRVANRDLAVIESISSDGLITARLDNNRRIEFDASEYRHFDHGYAVTSHSSQGLTAERVLVNADTGVHPDLLNSVRLRLHLPRQPRGHPIY